MNIFILLALLALIVFLNNNLIENYSSLSTIYPNQIKRVKDSCNGCAGLCEDCQQGKSIPSTCNKENIYHKLDNKDLPNKFTCIDDKDIQELINSNYLYIYSKAFNKILAFDTYATQSHVYIDNKSPNNNDCLSNQQYDEYCQNNKDTLPQKWRINIENYLSPNNCLVTITSYNCDGVKYYLAATKDGKVEVSLFGGDKNQVWQIIRKDNDDNYDGNTVYLIKSYPYCTYLTANNKGYLKQNTGIVSLTNVNTKYVGNETLWQIMSCGKRSLPQLPNKDQYKPFQSTLDFPWANDDADVKKGLPKDLKVSDDVNHKWAGRSVWLNSFDNVWNGNYSYQKRLPNNKLEIINKDHYKLLSEIIDKKFIVSINLNTGQEYPLKKTGIVNVNLLDKPIIKDNTVDGILITPSGKSETNTYLTYEYPTKNLKFNVETRGANILHGQNKDEDMTIFLEKIPNDKKKIRLTITKGDNEIVLQEIIS